MNLFFAWLAMGGYSIYVWSAYGLVAAVMVINLLGMKWKKKQTLPEITSMV